MARFLVLSLAITLLAAQAAKPAPEAPKLRAESKKVAQPVKAAAAQPVKAAAAQPVKAVAAQPVKAVAAQPVKAVAAQPVKAVAAQPVKAVAAQPVKAVAAKEEAKAPPAPKPVIAAPPPKPVIAFRTSADGVTRPLSAVAGQLVKLSDDGFGLTVEKKGDDTHFPKRGDVVTVHYVGKLKDGTVFDSSRDRKEPISFPIGRGKVIRGWDQGVITMSLGERGVLHVPSYKGYGSMGAPPAIPPNADLDFDVELLAINDETAPGFEFPKPPAKAGAQSLFAGALVLVAALALF
jgi:FK506-binding protein 1